MVANLLAWTRAWLQTGCYRRFVSVQLTTGRVRSAWITPNCDKIPQSEFEIKENEEKSSALHPFNNAGNTDTPHYNSQNSAYRWRPTSNLDQFFGIAPGGRMKRKNSKCYCGGTLFKSHILSRRIPVNTTDSFQILTYYNSQSSSNSIWRYTLNLCSWNNVVIKPKNRSIFALSLWIDRFWTSG
jgi:hypothetical protein